MRGMGQHRSEGEEGERVGGRSAAARSTLIAGSAVCLAVVVMCLISGSPRFRGAGVQNGVVELLSAPSSRTGRQSWSASNYADLKTDLGNAQEKLAGDLALKGLSSRRKSSGILLKEVDHSAVEGVGTEDGLSAQLIDSHCELNCEVANCSYGFLIFCAFCRSVLVHVALCFSFS